MRFDSVVIIVPIAERFARVTERDKEHRIQQVVPEPAILSMKAFWVGLPGAL
jgi:hypothetical protein